MPHNTQDVSDYHAGDALDIETTVEESDETAKDLTSATATWLLKEAATDPDADALLTKDTSGGGVEVTDAATGQLVIHIQTNDTTGMSGTKHHRLRVTDSNGDRVTVFTGSFTIEV